MTAPSLVTLVKRALRGEALLPSGSTLLVAVSGGPDSMALLSAMARVASTYKLNIVAHGVDHGLREDAAKELDLAESFAESIDVPFARTRVALSSRGGNLQERARIARWRALVSAARKHRGAAIATAHHADDRAETILMRILRGCGARGLAVLPAKATAIEADDVTVVRPLLRARRADVLLHLERHAVPFATDPSNADVRYLRTRVRSKVLPLLREIDPEIVTHLENISDELCAEIAVAGSSNASPSTQNRGSDWTASLPRPTQKAVADLLRTRSKDARVWLPDGLVLGIDERAKASRKR